MNKKILSLALALAMCLGLTTPVWAAGVRAPSGTGGDKHIISVEADDISGIDLGAKTFRVQSWNRSYDEEEGTNIVTKSAVEEISAEHVFALPSGSELVIDHEDGYVYDGLIEIQAWTDAEGSGIYSGRITANDEIWGDGSVSITTEMLPADTAGPLQGYTYTDSWRISPFGSGIEYYSMGIAGEIPAPYKLSADYLIGEFGSNTLLRVNLVLDQGEEYDYSYYYFLLTGEPNAAQANLAYASTQTVTVDGEAVEFQMYALKDENGNDTNYIKLRDLAYVLDGTPAQFEVGWDGAVNLEPGKSYTAGGTEMTTPYSGDRAYEVSAAETRINGTAAALEAIMLKDDEGGAYTYYKLRDLGEALGFNVGWSAGQGVFIESDKPYAG